MSAENMNSLFSDPVIVGGLRDLIISWVKQFIENYLKNAEFGDLGKVLIEAAKKGAITFLDELDKNVDGLPSGGFNDIIKPVAAVIISELRKMILEWPAPTPNPNPVVIGQGVALRKGNSGPAIA